LEQRALFRVHDQLIIREVQLGGSRRSQRPHVGDGVSDEPELLDRIGRLPGERSSDQLTRLLFAPTDDRVVEIRRVAILVEMQKPQRGSALEDERAVRIVSRDERDGVDEHVVSLDDARIHAVPARDLRDLPLRRHWCTTFCSSDGE